MRTKALLTMAALAAGALTTMAQSSNVYSLNIVGYVNVASPNGYIFISNPLDNGANDANTLFPNPNVDPTGVSGSVGPWDGSNLQEWTGASWKVSYFDSVTTDTTTGFTDQRVNPVVAPVLGSGKGFLFVNGSGVPTNITFVGQVRTGTNVVPMATRISPYALGGPLPLGGKVTTIGFANPNVDPTGVSGSLGPLDGCAVEQLKTTPLGAPAGYTVSYFDSITTDTTTGFTDQRVNPVVEPTIPVAGGFFFVNGSGVTFNWTQTLNP
jgi:hypothetical protein